MEREWKITKEEEVQGKGRKEKGRGDNGKKQK